MRDNLDRALDRNPDYPPGFRYEELEAEEENLHDEEIAEDSSEWWSVRRIAPSEVPESSFDF